MEDLIIIAVILVIVALAGLYVYRAKKRGVKCIGCPAADRCSEGCSGNCQGCSGGCSGNCQGCSGGCSKAQ